MSNLTVRSWSGWILFAECQGNNTFTTHYTSGQTKIYRFLLWPFLWIIWKSNSYPNQIYFLTLFFIVKKSFGFKTIYIYISDLFSHLIWSLFSVIVPGVSSLYDNYISLSSTVLTLSDHTWHRPSSSSSGSDTRVSTNHHHSAQSSLVSGHRTVFRINFIYISLKWS